MSYKKGYSNSQIASKNFIYIYDYLNSSRTHQFASNYILKHVVARGYTFTKKLLLTYESFATPASDAYSVSFYYA